MSELKEFGKRVVSVGKAVARGLVKGINEGVEQVVRIREENEKIANRVRLGTDDEIVIDLKTAEEIRWMNPNQLAAVFRGKKAVVRDSKVWQELRWMNAQQLEVVFGPGRKE